MNLIEFLKDRIWGILVNIISIIALSIFLWTIGQEIDIILLIVIVWFIILSIYILIQYFYFKHYFKEINNIIDNLSEKYLISEVIKEPIDLKCKQFFYILKKSNKSMLEQVSKKEREKKEYREYVEQWVHDIKVPICAIKLLCENNKSNFTRKILLELEKTNHFVEQALYYARSDIVEKDYIIREIMLIDIIHDAIAENKQLLLINKANIQIEDCNYTVYTDEKWIIFILNQVIINAIKYKKDRLTIKFLAYQEINKVTLIVSDNGIGILENDLSRIFDKGFTGENGRNKKSSTGIGLYLCKKLAQKLDIDINAKSKLGEGTQIILGFPKSGFVKIQN